MINIFFNIFITKYLFYSALTFLDLLCLDYLDF